MSEQQETLKIQVKYNVRFSVLFLLSKSVHYYSVSTGLHFAAVQSKVYQVMEFRDQYPA